MHPTQQDCSRPSRPRVKGTHHYSSYPELSVPGRKMKDYWDKSFPEIKLWQHRASSGIKNCVKIKENSGMATKVVIAVPSSFWWRVF